MRVALRSTPPGLLIFESPRDGTTAGRLRGKLTGIRRWDPIRSRGSRLRGVRAAGPHPRVLKGSLPALTYHRYPPVNTQGQKSCIDGTCAHDRHPVPLEYSIAWLTCAFASGQGAVVGGWPGATQDRLPAGSPDTRPRCPGAP